MDVRGRPGARRTDNVAAAYRSSVNTQGRLCDVVFEEIAVEVHQQVRLLCREVDEFINALVRPTWSDPSYSHHFPRTLYGYVMNAFAFVDLLSKYEHPTTPSQTLRMARFLELRMGATAPAAGIAVKQWRHTLMHTANPRVLAEVRGGVPTGVTFEWLLHWGEPWMDDQLHMSVHQVGKRAILNTGLTHLVRALDDAAMAVIADISTDARRRASVERVEAEFGRWSP